MKPYRPILRSAVAAAALVLSGLAQAGLVYTTYQAADEAQGDIANAPNSVAARNTFLGVLDATSVRTETFEGFSNGQTAENGLYLWGNTPATSKTPSLTVTPGAISNIAGDEFGPTGRFNTSPGCVPGSGCNWWETTADFTLLFGQSYSAFAFYGTDFSDFGATVWLDLLQDDGNGNLVVATSILVDGNQAPTGTGMDANGTGSLLHFGFTDDTASYAGVRFRVTQTDGSPLDYLGFDDIVLGNVAGTGGCTSNCGGGGDVPEPGSLALVALSLFGLAVARRKAQA